MADEILFYNDVRFCNGECRRPTMHYCGDSGYQQCQTCHWHTYGINGTYYPNTEPE